MTKIDNELDGRKTKNRSPVFWTAPEGPILHQGNFVCPGGVGLTKRWNVAPREHPLSLSRAKDPKKTGQYQPVPDEEWVDFELAHDKIRPHLMPLNGLPKFVKRPGRPSQDPEDNPTEVAIQLTCPARAGLVRCPLYKPSMDESDGRKLPQIHSAPTVAPKCCTRKFTTVRMGPKVFKWWQIYRMGSYRWTDRFGSARSRDEAVQAAIKSPNGYPLSGNLFEAHGPANVTLAVLASFIVNNWRLDRAHKDRIARNGGVPPLEDRARWDRDRQKQAERREREAEAEPKRRRKFDPLADTNFRIPMSDEDDLGEDSEVA